MIEWSKLVLTGNWRGQVNKYRKKEMRDLDSAKSSILDGASSVGTVLKQASFVCISCFPAT